LNIRVRAVGRRTDRADRARRRRRRSVVVGEKILRADPRWHYFLSVGAARTGRDARGEGEGARAFRWIDLATIGSTFDPALVLTTSTF